MEGFEWVLEIRDGMTGPARDMRSSLKSLEGELRATEAEMRRLQRLQETYRAAGFKQGAAAVGDDLRKLRLGAAETRAQVKQLASSVQEAGPSMMGEMAGAMGLTLGVAELASAYKAAATEAAHLAVEGLRLSVEMNELREHTTRMFAGLSGSAEGGERMYGLLQKMRKEVPESEAEIAHWASTLMAAGMTDPARVEASIRAMASASALMGGGASGAEAANKIQELTARALATGTLKGRGGARALVGTGITAEELAAELGMTKANFQAAFSRGTIEAGKGIAAMNAVLAKKGAGALAGTMGEWPVLLAKAKESFAHMFDGVDVKPLLGALRDLVGLLDTSQPSGRAMQQTLRTAFTDLARVATDAVRAATIGFLYLELGVLKVLTVLGPLIVRWREWQRSGAVLTATKVALVALLVPLGLVAIQVGVVVAGLTLMAAPILVAVKAATLLGEKLGWVLDKIGLLDTKGATADSADTWEKKYGTAARAGVTRAPGHAEGGIVLPAHGEVFASVAPGEAIVPAGRLAVGHSAATGATQTGGDRHAHVNVGGIHIDGAGKSAGEIVALLESMIADLFERAAAEAGA